MNFYQQLYLDENIKKPDKVKKQLNRGKLRPDIYVLVWSPELLRLELYTSFMLQQKYYKDHPPLIVGLASGWEQGIGLIAQIAEESLRAIGKVDFSAYLLRNRQQSNVSDTIKD